MSIFKVGRTLSYLNVSGLDSIVSPLSVVTVTTIGSELPIAFPGINLMRFPEVSTFAKSVSGTSSTAESFAPIRYPVTGNAGLFIITPDSETVLSSNTICAPLDFTTEVFVT